jgi:uncharacterized protein (TIGR02246 family)
MHVKLSALCAGFVMVMAFAAPSSANMAPPPLLSAENEIRAADAEMQAAVAAKDAAKAASFYADGGMVLPPGSPTVEGREALVAFWTKFFEIPGLKLTWELSQIKVSQSGDVAVTYGPYTMTSGEGANQTVDHGKSVVTWVMTDQGWRMYTDMFSSDGPAPKTAESAPPPAQKGQ